MYWQLPELAGVLTVLNNQKRIINYLFELRNTKMCRGIKEHCNLWRNYDDIDDSWSSVLKIIDFYGEDKGLDNIIR